MSRRRTTPTAPTPEQEIALLRAQLASLSRDNEALAADNARLAAEAAEGAAALSRMSARVASLESEMDRLVELIKLANLRFFAPRSERVPDDQMCLSLFNDAEAWADPSEPEPSGGDGPARPRRRGGRRRIDTSGLERVVVEHDLDDRSCPACGSEMSEMKVEVTEVIRLVPAHLVVEEHNMLLFPQKTTCHCLCCGMRFRSFVEGNFLNNPQRFNPQRYEHTRQDVLRPCCKSMPRHRILALWCEEHIDLLRTSKILYFAPEHSMMLWMRRNGVSCVTADLYNEADLKLDIQATGLPGESYDVIICNHVLEHVDDFRIALGELHRLLSPGGSLVCSFPMDPDVELLDEDPEVRTEEERVQRFGQNDHLRVFGMHADRLLEDAGFTVEAIRGDECPSEVLPIVGPADYDINRLFCCVKGE